MMFTRVSHRKEVSKLRLTGTPSEAVANCLKQHQHLHVDVTSCRATAVAVPNADY
jgi:hypothetical protein